MHRLLERLLGRPSEQHPDDATQPLELPWSRPWSNTPKRSAGSDFSRADYNAARRNAREVARATLGDELWNQLQRRGHLELPSRLYPGVTYRLRVGMRIEVRCRPGMQSPWPFRFLCINPTYPLPEEEFIAQLYIYLRDSEEDVVRVAAPQPWDQQLGRTF